MIKYVFNPLSGSFDAVNVDSLSISGTVNYVPKFTSANTIGDSSIIDSPSFNPSAVVINKDLVVDGDFTFGDTVAATGTIYGPNGALIVYDFAGDLERMGSSVRTTLQTYPLVTSIGPGVDIMTLKDDGSGGRVGILTSTPNYTLDVNGEIGTKSLYFDETYYNTNTTPSAVGSMYWDDGEGCPIVILKGGAVAHRIGQELLARVYNGTGSQLTHGQVVYITGSQGNRISVELANNTQESTSSVTFGVVTETIQPGQEGFVTISGTVRKLNTTGFTAGQAIWLGSTSGSYTATKPVAPAHAVLVGYIERVHASVGSIFVKIQNYPELYELHDVLITSPSTGQLLRRDSDNLWKNWTPNYATESYVTTAISNLVASAPATLDTLNELAAALGNDPNYATTISTALGNRLRVDINNQGLNTTQQANGRTNLGATTVGSNFFTLANPSAVSFPQINADNTVSALDAAAFRTAIGAGTLSAEADTLNSVTGRGATTTLAITTGGLTLSPAANTSALTSSTYSVTGSGTTPMVNLSGTVNTTGNVTPFIFDVTNTASGPGSFLVQIRRNGAYLFGIGLNDGLIYANSYVSISGAWSVLARENAINGINFGSTTNSTHTSGNRSHVRLNETFAPTSGTGTYSSLNLNSTVNQTGGANGITRGIYINPNLTAVADWRSLEWSNNTGWGLYGSGTALNHLSGNLLIGTTTDSAFKLDVNGNTRVQTTLQVGTANSANGTLRVERSAGNTGFILQGSTGYLVGAGAVPAYEPYNYGDASHNFNVAHATSGNFNWYAGNNATLNANTHLMRLTRGGNLLIGTTTDGGYKLDVNGTARVQGALQLNGAVTMASTLNVTGNTTLGTSIVRTYKQWTDGVPSNNLGDPTVTEMALFDEQFDNKTAFFDITKIVIESFDGTTWTDVTSSITETNRRKLVGGDAVDGGFAIPYGTQQYRITFDNANYVFLNALYSYWSSNGHNTQVHIWKKHNSGSWEQHTNSTALVNAWPGHLYLPFNNIAWHPTGTLGTHYNQVRVVFIPTWNASFPSNVINIYKIQLWGGYPASKRVVYTTNENRGVTFPSTLAANSLSVTNTITASGGSSTDWNTAYSERNRWDGGSTGLNASTGRTSLGATTVGSNLFTLANPSAVTFLRINADNTVSTLDAATFRTAIGAGTSSATGTVTSVAMTVPTGLTVSGSPITTSGTLAVSLQSGYSIPTTADQANWNAAYGWGNHANAGYLTSYTESDTLEDVTSRGETTIKDIFINDVRVGRGGTQTQVSNTVLGSDAMSGDASSGNNTGIGYQALRSLFIGLDNTAIGSGALTALTTGSRNIGIGSYAGASLTTTNNNIAIGDRALTFSTGSNNTAIGYRAGYQAGSSNVFLGYQAGFNETGSNTLYIANSQSNTIIYGNFSTGNVSIGSTSDNGYKLDVTGTARVSGNFTVDTDTLFADATNNMVGLGTLTPAYRLDVRGTTLATSSITVQGAYNVTTLAPPPAIGGFTLSAGSSLGVGSYWYFVTYVTALGETSSGAVFNVNTTAGNTTVNLTGIPVSSDPRVTARKIYRTKLNQNSDGQFFLATINNNTATTYTDTTSDASLTGAGLQYYKINSTSRFFTTNGTQAMFMDPSLTAFGIGAGAGIIGTSGPSTRTVLIGAYAGQSITSGQANVIVGQAGMYITTGSQNTIVGDLAGNGLTSGFNNTIFGAQAARYLADSGGNVIIGIGAGNFLANGTTQFTTGWNNVVVGASARMAAINDTNVIVIGSGSQSLGTNTTVIGNGSTIFSSIPAGNLGIGTTTDNGTRLNVNGVITATGGNSTNWNTAYSERNNWDGGSTNLVAATGRTSLGATTVGSNLFTLTNPSAITFLRVNADNTVSALDAAAFRTAIGVGTGTGTVTSVAMTVPTGLTVSGSPITSSGTLAVSLQSGYSIPTTAAQANWTTAYGWGNHATAGYLSTGGGTISTGNLYMNANYLEFTGTSGFPLFNSSAGNQIVLRAFGGANQVDMAIGSSNDTIWHSVPEYLDGYFFKWFGGETEIMALTGTGNLTVKTVTETSSLRYKENIVDLGPVSEKVEVLRPVTYNRIGQAETEIGLIAEEVAQIFPEVVSYDEQNRPDGINYSRLSAILIKTVQELSAEIKKLKTNS